MSIDIYSYLLEPRPIKIFLPLKNGKTKTLQGIAQLIMDQRQTLQVDVERDALSKNEEIDFQRKVIGTMDSGGGAPISIYFTPKYVASPSRLILSIQDYTWHEQKRAYFRVKAELEVSYWLKGDDLEVPAKQKAKSLNISAGGILIQTQEYIASQNYLGLEIILTAPRYRAITCTGYVVRTVRRKDELFESAIQFEEISQEDQDSIVTFCFEEQRKQLKEKVRVANRDLNT